MAFNTYQCEQYIKYLDTHQGTVQKIYSLIEGSPFTRTSIAKHIGLDYYAFHRRLKNKTFSDHELKAILEYIK